MANNYTIDVFRKGVKKSWLKLFDDEFKEEYFKVILDKIHEHIQKYPKLACFPPANLVFNAFTYFEVSEVKCIYLGMDPYIGFCDVIIDGEEQQVPQAMGLSFSVPSCVEYKKLPGSLKNIFKELANDIPQQSGIALKEVPNFNVPKHGDLTRWAKEEKILLLNSALTVMQKNSGVHLKYWEPFTDKIIKYISDNVDYVVFILLGNDAKKKIDLIDTEKHGVVTAAHPSPLNAKGGFLGSKVFSKANKLLEDHDIKPINWNVE